MIQVARKGLAGSVALALCLAGAACSSSSSSSSSSSTSASASASSSSSSSVSVSISVTQFDKTFSAMSALKPLAAAGHGNVAVLLPDTVTSARYVQFDAPYLTQAFTAAGLTASQFSVQNAFGSEATQLSDAQTAITKGASVLLLDQLTPGVGAQIETLAKSRGVAVIDYDRLVLGGSRQYYVSFNNVLVGTKIGQGFVACATAWHVSKPNVLVMYGDPTDNNATLFAQGYNGVLNPLFSSGSYVKVGNTAGSWIATVSLSEFQQQFTAHKNINSVLTPNDDNAAAIIHYLQTQGVKAKTFPTTGQDATTIGLQNILAGYQCGTVYKPIYLEAEASVALAMFVRAGKTPPATLVNGSAQDTKAGVAVPSVLLTPMWVTTANMASTVVADQFVKVAQLCVGIYAALCKNNGIS
jgi:D-xylose transport system substrate-binding protein